MTREEAIKELSYIADEMPSMECADWIEAISMAIEALEQEPCNDAISRQAVWDVMQELWGTSGELIDRLMDLPPVTPQPNMGHCKDCKYFEYDTLAKVNGIKLIVAHEICKRWGDGCQSKEDGYCFLFEPKTQEVEE